MTERPSIRTTAIPIFTLTLSSYFGSPGGSWLHINVVINWQLSKQGIRWPVSPDRVDPSRWSIFWSYPLTILFVFKWLQAQVYFFLKFTSNMLCLCQYQYFLNTGGEDLFLPWSCVGHAPRLIFMVWLVKIWQVSSCVKFMQLLESCLLWQLKLTEFWVNLSCF